MKQLPVTERQAEIVARVAQGLPAKRIAQETGLALDTVLHHIRNAAARVPGDGPPRHRLTLFFLNVSADEV